MKNRIPEFDVLRSLAILLILFHHLPQYYFNFYDLRYFGIDYDLTFINNLNRYLGLGLFTFSSGYLLYQKYPKFHDKKDIRRFLKIRYIRIFPLYLIALMIFIIGSGDFKIFSVIAHVLGVQELLASKYLTPIMTLWYIGIILIYYYMFAVIVRYFRNSKEFVGFGGVVFISLLILEGNFSITDRRLIVYLPTFLSGIIISKENILSKLKSKYILILFCSMFFLTFISYKYLYGIKIKTISFNFLSYVLLINVIMILFALITFYLSKSIVNSKGYKYLQLIAYSSLCMYLFHRPIWNAMTLIYTNNNNLIYGFYLIFFGTSLIIVSSYFLQKIYDLYISPIIERSFFKIN